MENKSPDGYEKLDKIAKGDEAYSEIGQIIHNTFSTEQGAKCLNILSLKFYSQECFSDDNPNPYIAAKRDGQRQLMQYIYDQISGVKNAG